MSVLSAQPRFHKAQRISTGDRRSALTAVSVMAVRNIQQRHGEILVVDPVVDAVSAAARAVAIMQRRLRRLPTRWGFSRSAATMNSWAANATAAGSVSASCRRAEGETFNW